MSEQTSNPTSGQNVPKSKFRRKSRQEQTVVSKLRMERRGEKLDGVVSFHGALATQTPAKPGVVRADILVEHGAADSMVTEEQVAAFKAEMDAAKVNYQFVSIPDAKHGFTNPDADRLSHGAHGGPDIGYNKAADDSSWKDMQAFFKKAFQ